MARKPAKVAVVAKKEGAAAAPVVDSRSIGSSTLYLVNPSGAVHIVDRAHARMRLREFRGYRIATDGEVAAYQACGGNQVAGEPIAPPFAEFELDELAEGVE